MSAASYLVAGTGNAASLCSACYGAERSLSRGKSRHVDEATYTETFSRLRAVTPNGAEARLCRDVLAQYYGTSLAKPWAFRSSLLR